MACDPRATAVVLAGGASSRFGSDKLCALWKGTPLIEHLLQTLPAAWPVVVVGPPRILGRAVTTVREDPPGSGPAAGVLTGIRAAADAEVVVTMPGDAPHAVRVARALLERFADDPEGSADVLAAGDPEPNPLHLALRGPGLARARELDPTDWANRSARSLLRHLAPVTVPVPAGWLHDVDIPADLR